MERDHLARMVYRELLDKLHECGGRIRRDDVPGAVLVTAEEATKAIDRLLKSGRIIESEGWISNSRIEHDLKEQQEFIESQREKGRKSASSRRGNSGSTNVEQRLSSGSTVAQPAVAVAVASANAKNGKDGPRANPFVQGKRVEMEREALRLSGEIATLQNRDPAEVFADAAHYEGAQRHKVNPASMTDDRLLNTVLDLRATLAEARKHAAKR